MTAVTYIHTRLLSPPFRPRRLFFCVTRSWVRRWARWASAAAPCSGRCPGWAASRPRTPCSHTSSTAPGRRTGGWKRRWEGSLFFFFLMFKSLVIFCFVLLMLYFNAKLIYQAWVHKSILRRTLIYLWENIPNILNLTILWLFMCRNIEQTIW